MTTPAYGHYGVPAYIAALGREADLLAAAAERAGMGAAVPSCPGWAVRDLLKHTGYVHRWAAGIVAQGLARPPGGASEEEILAQGPGDAELPGWFREGHTALVHALSGAPPDLDCWAFLAAPSPLAFWARRQVHETAIHRVDAEQAAGRASAPVFESAFAADGVDELIMGFLARSIRRGRWPGLDAGLAIHAADGVESADWLVTGGAGEPGVSRGTGEAACDVTGPARDLYLTLWNRRPPEALQVTGDPGILAAFTRELQITW
ncbi:MAG TPA: maleylpyruvate isomerase family mycothiol-dependent enzyme [Streptosporangiaceae bacterium]|nr:maleylpyruvate isomerase family mycothiol-dependent enzyme [Streptosporangiaceae bacterium]